MFFSWRVKSKRRKPTQHRFFSFRFYSYRFCSYRFFSSRWVIGFSVTSSSIIEFPVTGFSATGFSVDVVKPKAKTNITQGFQFHVFQFRFFQLQAFQFRVFQLQNCQLQISQWKHRIHPPKYCGGTPQIALQTQKPWSKIISFGLSRKRNNKKGLKWFLPGMHVQKNVFGWKCWY